VPARIALLSFSVLVFSLSLTAVASAHHPRDRVQPVLDGLATSTFSPGALVVALTLLVAAGSAFVLRRSQSDS